MSEFWMGLSLFLDRADIPNWAVIILFLFSALHGEMGERYNKLVMRLYDDGHLSHKRKEKPAEEGTPCPTCKDGGGCVDCWKEKP